MSREQYEALVRHTCEVVGIPDAEYVIQRGCIEVDGDDVLLSHYENDPAATYVTFDFGIVTAGRTLRVFRLLLEANLTVYAQDQAQVGLLPETGGILLIVRVPMSEETDGRYMADTFTHYAEHVKYWRDNVVTATDEQFDGLCNGHYFWLRA